MIPFHFQLPVNTEEMLAKAKREIEVQRELLMSKSLPGLADDQSSSSVNDQNESDSESDTESDKSKSLTCDW